MRKKYYLVLILALLILVGNFNLVNAESEEGYNILELITNQLAGIEDFRGIVVSRIYLDDELDSDLETQLESEDEFVFTSDDQDERNRVELRTGIMKSNSRSSTSNLSQVSKEEYKNQTQLLNLIPWLYLPPSYSLMVRALPMDLKFEYDNPLNNIKEIYNVEVIGEAEYEEQEVYILQLRNPILNQRWYVEQENNNLLRVEVFNSSNIKLFNIIYDDYYEHDMNLFLPNLIKVEDNNANPLLEVEYQNFEVNQGLTEEDFAQGFQDDYTIRIEALEYELESDPENDDLYWQLSELHYENGDLNRAIESLEQALKLNEEAKYFAQMARYYQDRGENQEALKKIDKALGLDYNNAEYHYLQGEIRLRLRELRQARHSFARAVSRDGNNTDYLERLYSVKNTLGLEEDDYFMDRARRTADRLVELEPDNAEYRLYLGEAYFALKDYEKAAREFKEAIDLEPANSTAHLRLAEYHQTIENYEKAEELYTYIVYIDNTIRNHRRLADFYFARGNYDLALNEYRKLQDRVSEDNEIRLRLAKIYLRQDKKEQAFTVYKELLAEDSNLLFKMAETAQEYSLNTAIDIYHLALAEDFLADDDKEKLYANLGRIYFRHEQTKAEDRLEELFKLDSRVEIYRQLAKTHFGLGNLDRTISYYKLIRERNKKEEDSYNLALAYLIVDEFNLAIEIGNQLEEAGKQEQGERIVYLAKELEQFKDRYDEEFVPGRIKRVEGDKLRRQGQINQALISYRAAATENYEYQMPYFYSGLINKVIGNNLAYEMALYGLEEKQRELLKEFATEIKALTKF